MDPLTLTGEEFVALAAPALRGGGGGREAARAAYARFHREGIVTAPTAGARIAGITGVQRSQSPEGEVVKFLLPVEDVGASGGRAGGSLETESVLIPMIGRGGERHYTLCVSSQVGCAMGCTFCETAQMGLIRSLRASEIVAQWHAATHQLGQRVRNIVFMGMGEPLDNFDEVVRAIAVLKDHLGPGVAVSRITVSTVGRLDGLSRLREKIHEPGWHRLNLAVSLNAPNDEVRSRIMPVNRAMPLAALQRMLLDWPVYGGGKLCLEYVLIPGVNDGADHAREIAEFVRPFRPSEGPPRALINLIPYNPRRDSPWPAPGEADVAAFIERLISLGVFVKRRRTKGRDMMGACGQLGNERIRRRRFVTLTREAHASEAS